MELVEKQFNRKQLSKSNNHSLEICLKLINTGLNIYTWKHSILIIKKLHITISFIRPNDNNEIQFYQNNNNNEIQWPRMVKDIKKRQTPQQWINLKLWHVVYQPTIIRKKNHETNEMILIVNNNTI